MLEGATCDTRHLARCQRRAPQRQEGGCQREVPRSQFTYLINATLDLPVHKKNADRKHDRAKCAHKPKRCICADSRRDKPSDQGELSGDHDPEPKPEVNQLLFDPIELGHSSSNVNSRGVDSLLTFAISGGQACAALEAHDVLARPLHCGVRAHRPPRSPEARSSQAVERTMSTHREKGLARIPPPWESS
jgi:hypothetical protein